jgi:hypothetical protein
MAENRGPNNKKYYEFEPKDKKQSIRIQQVETGSIPKHSCQGYGKSNSCNVLHEVFL